MVKRLTRHHYRRTLQYTLRPTFHAGEVNVPRRTGTADMRRTLDLMKLASTIGAYRARWAGRGATRRGTVVGLVDVGASGYSSFHGPRYGRLSIFSWFDTIIFTPSA